MYPFIFRPIFKERIWGGRHLETIYQKPLPPAAAIGESWEISDRPEGVSVIANGPLAGKDLRWLMNHHCPALLGDTGHLPRRFPLLVKILDAQQNLSLQVHPPPRLASQLGGEAKTEMWYITQAAPGAEIFLGLQRGVARADFESRLHQGGLADCFHRVKVKPGDAAFLPSGRLHALGAGIVLFEIQQNSDTTYRVYDWDRLDLNGKPRPLHLTEALASIDFNDVEPGLIQGRMVNAAGYNCKNLVCDPLFSVDLLQVPQPKQIELSCRQSLIIGCVEGHVAINEPEPLRFAPGQFCLVPACLNKITAIVPVQAVLLTARPGAASPD